MLCGRERETEGGKTTKRETGFERKKRGTGFEVEKRQRENRFGMGKGRKTMTDWRRKRKCQMEWCSNGKNGDEDYGDEDCFGMGLRLRLRRNRLGIETP